MRKKKAKDFGGNNGKRGSTIEERIQNGDKNPLFNQQDTVPVSSKETELKEDAPCTPHQSVLAQDNIKSIADSSDATTDSCSKRHRNSIVLGVIATLMLGVIGNAIWDMIFKPGIGIIGRFITGLSSSIDNAVFDTAALNPLPVADMVIILLLTFIPFLGFMTFCWYGFIKRPFKRTLERHLAPREESKDEYHKRLIRNLRIIASIGAIICIFGFLVVTVAFTVLNESVIVWRSFHKNLDICAQFMTSEEHTKTIAEFRRMKSRADFTCIMNTLNGIGATHSIELEWHMRR